MRANFKIFLFFLFCAATFQSCKQNVGKKKEETTPGTEATVVQRPTTPGPTTAQKTPFAIQFIETGSSAGNLDGKIEIRLDYLGPAAAGGTALPSCRPALSKDTAIAYVACSEGSNTVETLLARHARQVCRANSSQKTVESETILNLKNCKKAMVSPIQLNPDVQLNYVESSKN